MMELDQLRQMKSEELRGEVVKLSEQLFRIRFAQGVGKQEGIGRIRGLKKEIARVKTIEREQELAQAKAGR